MDDLTYYKKLSELQEEQIINLKETISLTEAIVEALKEQIELYKSLNVRL